MITLSKTNKKILFLLIPLVAIILIIIVLFYKKSQPPTTPTPSQPTPISVYPSTPTKDISVIITSPPNGSTTVNPASDISIEFSPNIDNSTHQDISYTINPQTNTSSTWKSDNLLVISPIPILLVNQSYSVTITYQNKTLYKLSFKTKDYPDLTPSEEAEIQAKLDVDYIQSVRKDLEENPWLNNIPIITDNYTVTYDPTASVFIVDFLKDFNASETALFKSEITTTLKNIGAPEKKIIYR